MYSFQIMHNLLTPRILMRYFQFLCIKKKKLVIIVNNNKKKSNFKNIYLKAMYFFILRPNHLLLTRIRHSKKKAIDDINHFYLNVTFL